MDSGEWFRWAAAFFLGALSTIAIEFGRGQFERRQRREDRRDNFQQETLVALQVTLATYRRAARSVWIDRIKDSIDNETAEERDRLALPPMLRSEDYLQHVNEYNDASFWLDILRERAADNRLRQLIAELQDSTRQTVNPAFDAPRSTSSVEPTTLMESAYKQVTARTGELLRML